MCEFVFRNFNANAKLCSNNINDILTRPGFTLMGWDKIEQ